MGNAGKKSNAFAKHVMWPFGGSRELAQIFFFHSPDSEYVPCTFAKLRYH